MLSKQTIGADWEKGNIINALQYAKPLTDPNMAAATLVSATADAMVAAANNSGGIR